MQRRPFRIEQFRHLITLYVSVFLFIPGQAIAVVDAATQERQCIEKGWKRHVMPINGAPRELLWKLPTGAWDKGAIIVLHGGGGRHFHWCGANAAIGQPQVKFTQQALAQGFAVFLLDSSDRVTDREGRSCGKIWDDEVRDRPNLDLPFIGSVMREIIPRLRPPDSKHAVFITGLSSGGYMAVRAGTHFDDIVTAFAPVSSGDPYGWHRVCEAGTTLRRKVHGKAFDNETGRQITEPGACLAERYPNERSWDSAKPAQKPAFRVFRHQEDGIHDQSCSAKISGLLLRKGYRGEPDFVLQGGRRSLAHHLWLEDYNRPILEFFADQTTTNRP